MRRSETLYPPQASYPALAGFISTCSSGREAILASGHPEYDLLCYQTPKWLQLIRFNESWDKFTSSKCTKRGNAHSSWDIFGKRCFSD